MFDNNTVVGADAPLIVIDDDNNLTEVNFDGYSIEKMPSTKAKPLPRPLVNAVDLIFADVTPQFRRPEPVNTQKTLKHISDVLTDDRRLDIELMNLSLNPQLVEFTKMMSAALGEVFEVGEKPAQVEKKALFVAAYLLKLYNYTMTQEP